MSRRVAALAAALVLVPATSVASAGGVRFVDVAEKAGVAVRVVCGGADKDWLAESMGTGAGWLDYDGDGVLDLYVVNGSTYERGPEGGEPNRLFRGTGKGTFRDVTDAAGVGHRGWGLGVAVGDYDNDGDPDLYVTNMGPNVLYRNDGDGTFTDVTGRAGVAGASYSSSAAFFDMDGDGDLDLYVGNYMEHDRGKIPARGTPAAVDRNCIYHGIPVACGPRDVEPQQDVLYRNDGGGRFTDVTKPAGLVLERARYALGVVTLDYDDDGDQDVYVANDSVVNSLWKNDGSGSFTDVGVATLSALNGDGRAQAGMGTDAGDWDGDGRLDLVVTNFSHDYNTLYRNSAGKYFVDVSSLAGLWSTYLDLSWGTGFRDFDNDGDLDLFIASGHVYPQVDAFDLGTTYRQRNRVFVNGERGRAEPPADGGGPGLALERSFRGAAFADYDDDGDVDVFVTAVGEPAVLLRNDTAPSGAWLRLRLVGTASNRDAVGARVVVTTGETRRIVEKAGGGSYLSTNDPRLHVGLGAATRVDRLEVRWPSGKRSTVEVPSPNRELTITE